MLEVRKLYIESLGLLRLPKAEFLSVEQSIVRKLLPK
jgi:hypothetical protein